MLLCGQIKSIKKAPTSSPERLQTLHAHIYTQRRYKNAVSYLISSVTALGHSLGGPIISITSPSGVTYKDGSPRFLTGTSSAVIHPPLLTGAGSFHFTPGRYLLTMRRASSLLSFFI